MNNDAITHVGDENAIDPKFVINLPLLLYCFEALARPEVRPTTADILCRVALATLEIPDEDLSDFSCAECLGESAEV